MIRQFIAAFGRNWLVLMSGAFTVPFAAAAVFVDSAAARAIWTLMALTMMFLAVYFVWEIERREAVRAGSELNKARLEIDHLKNDDLAKVDCFAGTMAIGAAQQNGIDFVLVAVNLSLKNTGAASALENWRFQFTVDGVTYDGQLLQPSILKLEMGESTVEITASDLIEGKAVAPIPRGGILRGWLVATMPSLLLLKEAQKIPPTGKINIFYSDVFGRDYSFMELASQGIMNGFYSFPDVQSSIKTYRSEN